MKRLGTLTVLAATLASCGNIPVATVPLPDVTVDVPVDMEFAGGSSPVFYLTKNQLEGKSIPQAVDTFVNDVVVSGQARHAKALLGTGQLGKVEVFVRQSVEPTPENCQQYFGQALVCTGDESAHRVGVIDFGAQANQNGEVPFRLGGSNLLGAIKARQLYVGFRIPEGRINQGDRVFLTNMQAVAKF